MMKTLLEDLTQPSTQTAQLAPRLILAGLGLAVVGGLLYLLTNKSHQEFVDLVPVGNMDNDDCGR